jgi:hypothetical protein
MQYNKFLHIFVCIINYNKQKKTVMATMKKTIGSPKKPKEPKYKEAGKYNTAGKEIGASRRGLKQYDRTSESEKNSVSSAGKFSGTDVDSYYKTKLGDSKYPAAINYKNSKVKQGDLKNLTPEERGERQTLARYKGEYEREKIGRVRENYGKPKANTRANTGTQTFITKTVKDADHPDGGYQSLEVLNDRTYGANRRFREKQKGGYGDAPRTRKNLLGRTVSKTKTVSFGAETKGKGTKAKLVGDKVITKNRTVTDNTGIPFLFGKKAKSSGRVRQVSRVGTSTNKAMKESGDTRGAVSGVRLGVTKSSQDTKTKLFKSHKRVEKLK